MEEIENNLKDRGEENDEQTPHIDTLSLVSFIFTSLLSTCLVSLSTNNVNCLPSPIIQFTSIKFVPGFSGILHYWPDALLHPLLRPLPLQLRSKQSLTLSSSLTVSPPLFYIPLSPLDQSIHPATCLHTNTHTCACVRHWAFPWQRQHENHPSPPEVPLICISFACFSSNRRHLTLTMAGKLAWPCPLLSLSLSLSVCVFFLLLHPFTQRFCHLTSQLNLCSSLFFFFSPSFCP